MAVSVQQLKQLAAAIAEQADESERLYQEANARYEDYQQSQQTLREMTAEFNVLAQQVARGGEEPQTVQPVSAGQTLPGESVSYGPTDVVPGG